MKILYITPNSIYENSGGGIETKKIITSINNLQNRYNKFKFYTISNDNKNSHGVKLLLKKNFRKDIAARFLYHSTYLFMEWNKIKHAIKTINPDVLILGNSRLGFIAKKVNKMKLNCFIIVHFHNIEYDYLEAYSLKFNKISSKIFNLIEKNCVKNDESSAIENMDLGLFLTKRDVTRAENIYKSSFNYNVLPICIEKFQKKLNSKNKYNINLVFLGSLWYGSNTDGILWFLDEVWKKLDIKENKINLIIGGSKPSEKFINNLKKYDNITLYKNFKLKANIIPKNSFFISPIQKGAGMKVKVAEALSMGLGIIGSRESLIGYHEAINDSLNKDVIFEANKPEEYIDIIKLLLKEKPFDKIKKNALQLHQKYYSIKRAESSIENILK